MNSRLKKSFNNMNYLIKNNLKTLLIIYDKYLVINCYLDPFVRDAEFNELFFPLVDNTLNFLKYRKEILNEERDRPAEQDSSAAPETGPAAQQQTTLPPAAVSVLKEGQQTTFANGQVWTLQNGKPVRVK
jgi:hypothetical protein